MSLDKDIAHYRTELSTVIRGRPWIVATDVLVAAARIATELLGLGADRVLAIGASRGTGDLPEMEGLESIDLGHRDDRGMMEAIRSSQSLLADLPQAVRDAVDRFDPQREARVIGTLFADGRPVAGRSVLGARPARWQRLEDKTKVDALWDEVGIPRAASTVVPASLKELWQAHEALDLGHGSVWAGDNREGWHGGAQLLRWVRSPDEAAAAHGYLAARCDTVRVMPFLEGIPCSIHGWVFKDEVISLRPCEMLVFRIPGSSRFAYSGSASAWMPRDAVRSEMEDAALRVGKHLQVTQGYLGCFTLDGVATADGFRPTELNPRFGAAVYGLQRSLPDLPLYLLHLACAEGLDLDFRAQTLQARVRHGADRIPVVRGMHLVKGRRQSEQKTHEICREGAGWRLVKPRETADGTLTLGPAAAGSVLFAELKPDGIQRGRSAAADVCGMMSLAARLWNLPMDDFHPAPDQRDGELNRMG